MGQVGTYIKKHYYSNKVLFNQLVHSKKAVNEQAAVSALQKFYDLDKEVSEPKMIVSVSADG